ncbi:U4/U6 small nuclear ribonucleoprotein Prp31 [Pseudolycoriella hygida]|uniref:U4/U6 small nuclear ribonucleoprotein Prp31 n=1 Tax=Pseudolycoriella hygida TaxID=35572 RepID=A0A9Q0RUW1_9DIPT|nr:U4/U6 small nuclear ribonucleoprotein Prp31 [Pseudolycoriella hygida]
MSLADELLADLEEPETEDIANELNEDADPVEELMETEESPDVDVDVKVSSIRELCKLHDSEELTNILKQIDHYLEHPRKPSEMIGNVESDPEYQLIVEANSTAVEIDNEICMYNALPFHKLFRFKLIDFIDLSAVIHKFTKSRYQKRFPELDSLIVGEMEYLNAVKELGNDLDEAKNNEKLQQILTQATIMIVSVTASTTQGTMLTDIEKAQINEACDMAIDLNNFKLKIYEYVESRMTFIAPNLSMIIGASTAAKILGIAGGLTKLSKMPACNLQVLGSQKKTLSGFSKVQMLPHTGFVYYSQIVQDTNPDLRRKAARLVAAKCALAARVDACHESVHGEIGLRFKEDIEKKLDKLQEPPPVKFAKPLPKPIEGSKKKRGGKRVRKMKERYALTEFRKQANRLNFGDIDEDAYQEDLGYSRGTIGKAGTGRIRLPQLDEKTKVRISKTLHKNLQKQQVYGGSTTVRKQISGTASSVAFTPLQGLEIVNPQAAERSTETNAKYFSNTSGFLSVGRK